MFGHNLARERGGTLLIARIPPHCVNKAPNTRPRPYRRQRGGFLLVFFFLQVVVFQLSHVHSPVVVKRKAWVAEQRTVDVNACRRGARRESCGTKAENYEVRDVVQDNVSTEGLIFVRKQQRIDTPKNTSILFEALASTMSGAQWHR